MKRVLKELELTHIAAVDRPCQEGALAVIMKRDPAAKQEGTGMKKASLDTAELLTDQLLDHDGFDDFAKAYADVVDCMRDCDGADTMIAKFEQSKDVLGEIVADAALSKQGKHDELHEGLVGFLDALPAADVAQLGKALRTGARLRKLSARTDVLKLKTMHARLGVVHRKLKDSAA